jgi:uncharacterized protein (DUF1501 family)
LGGALRAGFHGSTPDLSRLVDGDLPFTTDFRAVYAALEKDWMGCSPSSAVPAIELFKS